MTNRVRKLYSVLLMGAFIGACSDDPTTTETPLTAPANVSAQAAGSTGVTVTYSAVTGASSYTIERAAGTAAFASAGTSTTTSFSDTGLLANTTYRYRVQAISGTRTGPMSTEVSVTTATTPVVSISADITTSRTLFADSVYKLTGFIHVANGATLTIQPGTLIQGDFNTLGSSLFILRGAKIIANGTAAKPIVFTSSQPAGSRRAGDWGGLIIVGNGIANRAAQVEGTGTSASNYAVSYAGGTNNSDSSGELAYVRVEFAGFGPSPNAELNTFTFAAVGSGTKMDYLQAISGLDDAFEFFGGAVDGKHLVSYNTGDDHFDMSEGYVGRLQYLIAYQSLIPTPRTGAGSPSGDPQGIENDGCDGAGCTNGQASTPFTIPLVANFTLIGTGPLPVIDAASGGYGVLLRRGTGGFYVNGAVARWPKAAFAIRDASTTARTTAGDLIVSNVLTADNAVLFQAGQQVVDSTSLVKSTATTASLFTLFPTAATSAASFDWTPSANSPLRTGGLSTFPAAVAAKAGSFVTPTSYVGAADPNGAKWWAGWTVYFEN